MENNETLTESFKKELDQITTNKIFNPVYRKKKLFMWLIRTLITTIIYMIFWKFNWVKWTLLLTIPSATISLFMIACSPYLLKRKIERTKKKIEETEKLLTKKAD